MTRRSRPETSDATLRALFQGGARETAPGEPCPAPEEIWDAARGALEPTALRRVIDHTGRCPSCAEDWRLARALDPGASETAPAVGEESHPAGRSFRPPHWLRAVAALLLVGVVVLFLQPVEEPVTRDGEREEIQALVPEDRPLARSQPTLAWSGPEGAVYTLVATTERLEVLARVEGLREPRFTLPRETVSRLEPGTVVLWQVEAVLPDGSRVPSRTFRVRLE